MTIFTKSLTALTLAATLSACSQPSHTPSTASADQANRSQTNQDHSSHSHHDTTMPIATHTADYMQSMNTMHDAMMAAAIKADADTSFVEGMIAHHQGAIEMAKIQLQYGQDEKLKNLAQDIINAQEPEITLMTDWLANKGIKANQ